MSSRLLENAINTSIKSDFILYDLIVKHVVTSNVSSNHKL